MNARLLLSAVRIHSLQQQAVLTLRILATGPKEVETKHLLLGNGANVCQFNEFIFN